MNSILIATIFAITSPLLYGLMNILDKYVVAHKVKKPLSFAVLAGILYIPTGLILAAFLNWTGYTFIDYLFPILSGLIIGVNTFVYYAILKKEDASSTIGLMYVYPLLVAFLSFLFLNEKLPLIGYLGVGLILFGAIMLSVRIRKIRLQTSIWLLASLIICVALDEFFIKIATNHLPEWNGLAVNIIALGLVTCFGLFNKNIRIGFIKEFWTIKWAFLTETFGFLGGACLFFAMGGLPATVVSSIAAIQPLAVLVYERILHAWVGKMSRDVELLPKLIPICLIVIGILLLYSSEILKAIIG
jgi:transporter family protein